jgi:hypothetical protein
MRNTADVTGGKPIAVFLQPISGVSAINPLVAFYDLHGGKREVIFFYFVPNTTRDLCYTIINNYCTKSHVVFGTEEVSRLFFNRCRQRRNMLLTETDCVQKVFLDIITR